MRSFARKYTPLAMAVCACPFLASAQSSAPLDSTSAQAIPIRTNLVLINPFGLVFNALSGEYEHVVSKSASVGFAGTYYAPSDFNYFTSEIKVRYYPSEHAPDGFSVGLSGGITHVTGDAFCVGGDVCEPGSSVNRPTLGFDLDYNWLLGPTRRFAIGTGIGAKRFFGNTENGSIDGLPTARVALGVAF